MPIAFVALLDKKESVEGVFQPRREVPKRAIDDEKFYKHSSKVILLSLTRRY